MFKQITTFILICILPGLAGCREMVNVSRAPNKHVETWQEFDPNDYDIHIERNDETIIYGWKRDYICRDCPEKFTLVLPYLKKHWFWNKVPAVCGQLNGTSYPVFLDTGNPLGVLITDIHINKHSLPVYFFDPDDKSTSYGLAIADLTLGKVQFEKYPCYFFYYHTNLSFPGFSSDWLAATINFPLDFMSSFSWIQFDQVQKELTLSTETFAPGNESQWITFPFEITEKQIRVFVDIEGIHTQLFLDTGGGGQLSLDRQTIAQVFEKRPDFQKIRKKKTASLLIHGKVNELAFTAKAIQFGDGILDNVIISYDQGTADPDTFPYKGSIGIDLFKKTVVVLDFEKKQIWVKKAEGCLFKPAPAM